MLNVEVNQPLQAITGDDLTGDDPYQKYHRPHCAPAGTTVQSLAMDSDGDGTDDMTTTDPTTALQYTYTASGIYLARLRVTDNQSAVYEATAAVQALAQAYMDARFQALWSGLTSALVAGDKNTAISFLTPNAQDKYGPVFDALMSFMPDIIASYSALQPVSVSPDIAEYAVSRIIDGRNRIFLIYFMRDFDGVWRIDAM